MGVLLFIWSLHNRWSWSLCSCKVIYKKPPEVGSENNSDEFDIQQEQDPPDKENVNVSINTVNLIVDTEMSNYTDLNRLYEA